MNGGSTRAGILPSVTIGSENTMRISLASAMDPTSPVGANCTTVSAAWVSAVLLFRDRGWEADQPH